MHLLLCKISKKSSVDPGNPIFRSKMAHLPYMRIFFRKTINITSMYFLVPFIVQKFKKIFRADIKLWGYTIFWPKMGHLPQIKIFSKKPLIQFPCSWWFFSLCKISKVSFQYMQGYLNALLLRPKWPICPKKEFFQ